MYECLCRQDKLSLHHTMLKRVGSTIADCRMKIEDLKTDFEDISAKVEKLCSARLSLTSCKFISICKSAESMIINFGFRFLILNARILNLKSTISNLKSRRGST